MTRCRSPNYTDSTYLFSVKQLKNCLSDMSIYVLPVLRVQLWSGNVSDILLLSSPQLSIKTSNLKLVLAFLVGGIFYPRYSGYSTAINPDKSLWRIIGCSEVFKS